MKYALLDASGNVLRVIVASDAFMAANGARLAARWEPIAYPEDAPEDRAPNAIETRDCEPGARIVGRNVTPRPGR